MKVFDKPIQIKRKEDGTFLISIEINDGTVIVKSISEKTARLLFATLEQQLGE